MSESTEYKKPSGLDLAGVIFLNAFYFGYKKMWMPFFVCVAAMAVAVGIDPDGGETARGIYALVCLVLTVLVWKEKIKIPA